MHKAYTFLLITILIVMQPLNVVAKDRINTQSISNQGFDNVSQIIKQMSPEQLEEVRKQAEAMMPELEKMSPEEIDAFTKQLLEINNSIDYQDINVKKLDTKKKTSIKKIKSDIKKYKQQR